MKLASTLTFYVIAFRPKITYGLYLKVNNWYAKKESIHQVNKIYWPLVLHPCSFWGRTAFDIKRRMKGCILYIVSVRFITSNTCWTYMDILIAVRSRPILTVLLIINDRTINPLPYHHFLFFGCCCCNRCTENQFAPERQDMWVEYSQYCRRSGCIARTCLKKAWRVRTVIGAKHYTSGFCAAERWLAVDGKPLRSGNNVMCSCGLNIGLWRTASLLPRLSRKRFRFGKIAAKHDLLVQSLPKAMLWFIGVMTIFEWDNRTQRILLLIFIHQDAILLSPISRQRHVWRKVRVWEDL